jgi:hypothetical protein
MRGHPDEAARLVAEAHADAAGHVPSEVVALALGAVTHQLLGDPTTCARHAQGVQDLCERFGIGYYGEWAAVLLGWTRGRAGVDDMRRHIDNLDRMGAQLRIPYWPSLLAEHTSDPDEARGLLDRAVAVASRNEELLWLPEVWRRQAELLPGDEAAALLVRAEALAERQGTAAWVRRCRAALASTAS